MDRMSRDDDGTSLLMVFVIYHKYALVSRVAEDGLFDRICCLFRSGGFMKYFADYDQFHWRVSGKGLLI